MGVPFKLIKYFFFLNGKVDLVEYISLQTKENIYKDKFLPLGDIMKEKYISDYVIVSPPGS
tara:strand:- start:638 stop:820 length:183 start_codon:yes stop_codon:yes gene_type:complete